MKAARPAPSTNENGTEEHRRQSVKRRSTDARLGHSAPPESGESQDHAPSRPDRQNRRGGWSASGRVAVSWWGDSQAAASRRSCLICGYFARSERSAQRAGRPKGGRVMDDPDSWRHRIGKDQAIGFAPGYGKGPGRPCHCFTRLRSPPATGGLPATRLTEAEA